MLDYTFTFRNAAAFGSARSPLDASLTPRQFGSCCEASLIIASYIVLAIAAIPGIYYGLVIYSTLRYFRVARRENPRNNDFFPPISCLKPIRGLDDDAYENYASFCRQDYPGEYEIVFCVDRDDPALPVSRS